MNFWIKPIVLTATAVISTIFSSIALADDKLVVYSSRKEALLTPIFDAYTKETGIKIELITAKAAPLIIRIQAEGKRTQADILFTVDGGNLWHASQKGILLPLESPTLEKNIPANYRSENMEWFGFSLRARTIFYSPERVDVNELSTYEDLASDNWQNRLCLRTSKKVYNQSLVATMIENHGKEKTSEVVKGWVKNLSVPVFSSDIKILEAINAGVCDVGIANTYYYGRKIAENPDFAVNLFWANQDSSGTHVNVSGAGVLRHSKNAEKAQAFLEWLSQGEAQKLFAQLNKEFPSNPNVEATEEIKAWGEFKPDNIDVETAGELQAQSIKLMDNAGYK